MSKTIILTDSASDIPVDMQEKYGIDIMNFAITLDGKSYTERVDFTFDEYYEMLRTAEGMPSTAHITSIQFLDKYMAYDDAGYTDVIHITICAAGSATNDAAHLAAIQFKEERPNSNLRIHIVDSHTYSMVYGYHVLETAKKIKNGAEVKLVLEDLEQAFASMEVILAAYTLRFMKKSGRVSAAAAFAGELLGLKPIVTLIDGKSQVQSKVRGDAAVMPAMLKLLKQRIVPNEPYMIGTTDDTRAAELAKLAKKEMGYAPTLIFKLGSAVSTNTGPDAIAFVYMGEKRTRE
ncbi:MAG: DegV family protein [Oscillospiraceae bacterium]|nr:DegV family protein [Oscillospiraceae bacterium]